MKAAFRFFAIAIFTTQPLVLNFAQSSSIFIRTNQVGFKLNDIKAAVVLSKAPLSREKGFVVRDLDNKQIIYRNAFNDSVFSYGEFPYCYTLSFTKIKKTGRFKIEINGVSSCPFSINNNVYNTIVDSLLLFFKVQRCGPTNPYLHAPCHLSDVARVKGEPNLGMVDVTGGWHDAGDYIKFLSTIAYSTYMMIFSYEFDKERFDIDDNHNGVPDILEEAKIGLDWLLRANYMKDKLITQVQDVRDHDVGWRLPGNDTLRYDRVGIESIGKNQVGIFCAAMALGAKVWKEKFKYYEFANKCLDAAVNIYSIRNQVPNIDSTGSRFYKDKSFFGKLALGAIELYNTTNDPKYLKNAETYGDSAKSDYWWSWGDINSLADYRIAQHIPRFSEYIFNNLDDFNNYKEKSIFKEGMDFSWGTTNSLLGIVLQNILYSSLTGENTFDSLATYQKDYILGRNPWGISFIYSIGSTFPVHLHSQVAYFNNGYLPGALTAGPAPESLLKAYKIDRTNFKYDEFNTKSVKYYDDRMDFITNEPTIVGNATAIFVFGNLKEK
jgi:endoglucanase